MAPVHSSTVPNIDLELILRDPFPHSTGTRNASRNHLQQIIHIIRSRPFLMRDNVNLIFHLGFLDQFAVRAHSLLRVGLGELVRDEGRGVQTCERDELPAVAEFTEALDVGFLFFPGHGRFPVEGG